MPVSFSFTNLNSVIQSKLDALTSSTSANDLLLTIRGIESAFSTILDGTSINTVNAIESAGTTQVSNVNTAGTTQVSAVNTAGTTQTTSVNDAGTSATTAISTARSGALTDIETARIAATNSVSGAAGGTNPFLLMGA